MNKVENILLVYPEIPKATYWSFSTALELLDKKANMPPLGLLTVASLIPKDYKVKLVDTNVENLNDSDIKWADIVFISSMIVQKESLNELIDRINKFNKTVVVGGPYPSSCYAEIKNVDCFIIGEAEGLINLFFNDLKLGRLKKVYAKPVRESEAKKLFEYFGNNSLIDTQNQYPSIDICITPTFNLLNKMELYQSMAIQTSRGCPIGCEFCDIWRRFGKKPRYKNFSSLELELNELYNLGWRGSVFIVDDNFIGNKSFTKELLQKMEEWQKSKGYPFTFYTEATITLADDDELLCLMRDAGFDYVFMGIETPSEESLKETRKHINTKGKISDKVSKIQSYGIQVASGFIVGFDNDPENISNLMINCINELGIPMAMVGLLQPLPDTDLTDRLIKENRLIESASGNNTHEFTLHFKTKREMSNVINDYKKILQSIYSLNLKTYFERCVIFRNRYRHNPNFKQRLSLIHIKAFIKFIFKTIFKKYRFQCWKFLTETLFLKPKFFSTACTLAIQGHHFREITKLAFEMEKIENLFANKLKLLKATLGKELETKRTIGEQKIEQLSYLIEKYKFEIGLYVKPKLNKLSKKYGISLEKKYLYFISRLEIELEKIAIDALLTEVPI